MRAIGVCASFRRALLLRTTRPGGQSAVVVGLGNIGSHLVSHLARLPGLERLILVDKGTYEQKNLACQAIRRKDVGKRKAQVQSLRVKQVNPSIDAVWVCAPVEDVPLARLRADVILACVDGRAARRYLNQAARHLGVPWIDAGVHAEAMLARVSVFSAATEGACLQCTWDQADYDLIEQVKPCEEELPDEPATGAPAQLGALAAAQQAIECERLLASPDRAAESFEIVIDAGTHRTQQTSFRRTAACRLASHAPWPIHRLGGDPAVMSLAQAFTLVPDLGPAGRVWMEGVPFVRRLTCLGCGRGAQMFRLRRALVSLARRCKHCGDRLVADADGLLSAVSVRAAGELVGCTLASIGMKPGDVFAIGDDRRTEYFELDAAAKSGTRSKGVASVKQAPV